ncbi:hypothetical protein SEA_EHYELIMAYOE_210 [Streptomyces phage EhyElimayoE]|nr:hypothetical protein SEA_EHYELIMAYOE_210 [Streptomyces phage EhyElimayoE]
MIKNLVTVQGSIEFRDVVMTRDRENRDQPIYVRLHGFEAPTYRILARHVDPFQKITLDDLFASYYAPVYMEDFAQALIAAESDGPKVDIFTL